MISERGDCKVMVSIDLERWSKRSSWFFKLGERYRVQMYFVLMRKGNFQPEELKAWIRKIELFEV